MVLSSKIYYGNNGDEIYDPAHLLPVAEPQIGDVCHPRYQSVVSKEKPLIIGFAGFANFDILCSVRDSATSDEQRQEFDENATLLLLDINSYQLEAWNQTFILIDSCEFSGRIQRAV